MEEKEPLAKSRNANHHVEVDVRQLRWDQVVRKPTTYTYFANPKGELFEGARRGFQRAFERELLGLVRLTDGSR